MFQNISIFLATTESTTTTEPTTTTESTTGKIQMVYFCTNSLAKKWSISKNSMANKNNSNSI